MTTQLTHLYEWDDWKRCFATTRNAKPLILTRSEMTSLAPVPFQPAGELDKVTGKGFSAEKYAKTLGRTRRAHE